MPELRAQQDDRLMVSRDRAAALIDVSTRLIDDAIREGQLLAFRVGRRVLIRRRDLEAFAQRVPDGRASN
jgi:excisionase family DNA binding protein